MISILNVTSDFFIIFFGLFLYIYLPLLFSADHICWKQQEFLNENKTICYFCVFLMWNFSCLMKLLLTHWNIKKNVILNFPFSDSTETTSKVLFYVSHHFTMNIWTTSVKGRINREEGTQNASQKVGQHWKNVERSMNDDNYFSKESFKESEIYILLLWGTDESYLTNDTLILKRSISKRSIKCLRGQN